ncbi:MAG: DUF5320 domain-containing protein [Candidatus Fermentithermobacillus carboniphilus]|uniref:DUF5320 domain-containing protein n=1 Tax=Candidatus Fermentithermobacillus carboniphilus TaxID=3085328 RepID=A0AAT9LEU9_9FIRM|nr:MAG: DUF5320 domain-containing protein [Candidatus Fermentithermobacillus carboniphilus]
MKRTFKEVMWLPGFDGTGHWGQGPMTGRGQGFCADPIDVKAQNLPAGGRTGDLPPEVLPQSGAISGIGKRPGAGFRRRLGRGGGNKFAAKRE